MAGVVLPILTFSDDEERHLGGFLLNQTSSHLRLGTKVNHVDTDVFGECRRSGDAIAKPFDFDHGLSLIELQENAYSWAVSVLWQELWYIIREPPTNVFGEEVELSAHSIL